MNSSAALPSIPSSPPSVNELRKKRVNNLRELSRKRARNLRNRVGSVKRRVNSRSPSPESHYFPPTPSSASWSMQAMAKKKYLEMKNAVKKTSSRINSGVKPIPQGNRTIRKHRR
jgi:hypothetical protein